MIRALFVAVTLILVSRPSLACQCADRPSIAVAAARSDVVAVGRIERVSHSASVTVGGVKLRDAVVATMAVEGSWKRAATTLDIVSGFSDCDYTDFALGDRYLVFGASEIPGVGTANGMVWAPRCWPTQQYTGSLDGLSDLGQAVFKAETLANADANVNRHEKRVTRRTRIFVLGIIIIAVVFVLAAALWYKQRQKK